MAFLGYNQQKLSNSDGSQGKGLIVKGNHCHGRKEKRGSDKRNSRSKSKGNNKKNIKCHQMGYYKECPKLKLVNDKKNKESSNSASVVESNSDYDDDDMLSISSGISDHLVDS